MAPSNPGRRPQTDFQTFGGPSDFPLTGAQDRNRRANKGDILQDTAAKEAASGSAGFEGSFITIESPGMCNKTEQAI